MRRMAAAMGVGMALWAGALSAQAAETLRLISPDGRMGAGVAVERHRGYAVVPFRSLERLGWGVAVMADGGEARRAPHRLQLREGTPFFRWDDELLQLTHAPYRIGLELWVPLQLLSDFLPQRLPDDYRFEGDQLVVRARTASAWTMPADTVPAARIAEAARAEVSSPPPAPPVAPPVIEETPMKPVLARDPAVRPVVVIDPGHGGQDPGARGPGGVREKDVALA